MFIGLVLVVALGGVDVDAELRAAKISIDGFDFARALSRLTALKETPGLTRAQSALLYEYEGVARSTRGDTAGARESFRRLLTLDPAHPVPAELPPKIRTLYFAARTAAGNEKLELIAEPPRELGEGRRELTVRLGRSSLFNPTAVRWVLTRPRGAPQITVVPVVDGAVQRLEVQAGAAQWSATLLGPREWELASAEGTLAAPPPPAPLVQQVLEAPPPASDWGRPLGGTLLGAGAIAVGVGVYFAVEAADARNRLEHPTTDANGVVTSLTEVQARQLEGRATSGAIVANTLMATGAVVAAAGIVVFFAGPRAPPRLVVAPTPNGLAVGGRF